MSIWGWQGEASARLGPPRHFRLPFLIAAVVIPLMVDDPRYMGGWAAFLALWSLTMVGPSTLARWVRLWIPLTIVYGAFLYGFGVATEPLAIAMLISRLLLALLGMQILQWSVPPSDVVSSFEWVLPRLGVSLAIALRLVPRLERSARWRLATLSERGFNDDGSTMQKLRLRSSLWPGWFADALDHAHDLGDAVQSRGLLSPRKPSGGVFRATLQRVLGEDKEERSPHIGPFSDMVQLGLDIEMRLPDGRSIGRHKRLLRGGSVIMLKGPSGCGKSSLLRVLAGVSPWQHPVTVHGKAHLSGHPVLGEVDISSGPFTDSIACWIPQDPDRHGIAESVRREFSIARRLAGEWSQESMLEELEAWNLLEMLDEKPEELSDGEQQRLLLAAHLDPIQPLWLLDEADVHLDEVGFIQLGKAVVKHRARGGLVIVVAHRHARWSPIADEVIEMVTGEAPTELPICEAPSKRAEQEWTPPVIRLFSNQVEPVRAGDLVVVTGENGTGKTTLLREWAAADGIPWLPTSPDRRLLGMTVGEELTMQHPLLRQAAVLVEGARLSEEAKRLQIRQSRLRLNLGLSHLSDVTPVHDLSCGERRRLSLLPLLISEPRIMLLDEIDHALDDSMLAELLRLLGEARADGCALILTSHSPDLALWASMSGGRRWLIEDGVMSEVTV